MFLNSLISPETSTCIKSSVCRRISLQNIVHRNIMRAVANNICAKATHTGAISRTTLTPLKPYGCNSYATRVGLKLSGPAAKQLANDGSGKHTHVGTQTCILPGCDGINCKGLCDKPKDLQIEGHNTHKPIIGRIARFISEKDTNGDDKSQYFVKTNKKVKISEQEKQSYGKHIKEDSKTTAYVYQHTDKYDK